ncbi:MAG: Spermidine N(1)-acetyltransferase [Chloroflexi bacterium ADurb.Bin222]|nr:MAG: Spermidine N(1)-acetyltransferase [Chloroflexi bacterium ADurb.Bin222]
MYYNGQLIRLRPSEAEDIPLFVRWLSNPELRDYVTIRYISEALERRWFEGLVAATSGVAPQRLHFVIETLESSQSIGVVGLEDINWRDRHAEFGIIVGEPDFWGKGFGSDAVRTTLAVGFRWFNLHRIFLHVVAENARAIRAYEKCGFTHEGRLRDAIFIDGMYHDLLLMSLLADEFTLEP